MTDRDVARDRRGDWMQTYTGRRFWPLDPRREDVRIEDIAHALALQTRFGGHCQRFYSVAEHSVRVCRAAAPEHALYALLHDASEAYLSDLVRPLKRFMPEYKAAEDAVTWAVYQAFGLDPAQEPREVKVLDNRILIDERSQNMRPTGEPWHYGGESVPLGVTLEFWPPERAEAEFLAAFYGLATALPEVPPEAGRQWWPEAYIDEMMPDGRPTPSAWLYRLDDGAHRYGQSKDQDWTTWPISEGEIVKFMACDDLGLFQMRIEADGKASWGVLPPADAYLFETGDPDMSGDGPEEFEANLRDIAPPEPGQAFEVSGCRWGDVAAFRFTAQDGPPRFLPLSHVP